MKSVGPSGWPVRIELGRERSLITGVGPARGDAWRENLSARSALPSPAGRRSLAACGVLPVCAANTSRLHSRHFPVSCGHAAV